MAENLSSTFAIISKLCDALEDLYVGLAYIPTLTAPSNQINDADVPSSDCLYSLLVFWGISHVQSMHSEILELIYGGEDRIRLRVWEPDWSIVIYIPRKTLQIQRPGLIRLLVSYHTFTETSSWVGFQICGYACLRNVESSMPCSNRTWSLIWLSILWRLRQTLNYARLTSAQSLFIEHQNKRWHMFQRNVVQYETNSLIRCTGCADTFVGVPNSIRWSRSEFHAIYHISTKRFSICLISSSAGQWTRFS